MYLSSSKVNAHQFLCSVSSFSLSGIETRETTCPFMAGKEHLILSLTKQTAITLFLTDTVCGSLTDL